MPPPPWPTPLDVARAFPRAAAYCALFLLLALGACIGVCVP